MSVVHNGHLFTDTGQMTALNAAAGVPATAKVNGGWAHAAAGGPYVEDLVAGAVPAGSVILGSLAFHPDGRLYVTTQAVAATDTVAGGLRIRADGALRIIVAAVDPSDVYSGGWAIKQSGEARMSIT